MNEKQALEMQDWFSLDDDILVKAHLSGDERAFQVLFKKYREMVTRLVFSIQKSESLVEDTVQEVFLLIHRNLPKFRGQSALKTWIYRITVNEAIRHLNRSKRWVPLPEGESDPIPNTSSIVVINQGESPERIMIEGEQKSKVNEALKSLKDSHSVILTLFYLEDMNIKEISEILEIPEGSVKSRLFYAREALKNALEPVIDSINPELRESNALR